MINNVKLVGILYITDELCKEFYKKMKDKS
jgi:hypothetical protein